MHLISRFLLVLSICLCPSSSSGDEPFREFSSPEGKTIKARPVNVNGKKVRLAFEDGRKMDVAPDAFKQEDQTYLKDWVTRFLASNHSLFAVSAARKEDKVKDFKENVTLVDGRVVPNGREVKVYEGYYVITLENRSDFELNPLRVEYRVFSKKDNEAKKNLHDMKYERLEGTLDFTLKPRSSLAQKTTVISMEETKLGQGISWDKGGGHKSQGILGRSLAAHLQWRENGS